MSSTYAFVAMVALLALAGLQNLLFAHGFQPDPPSPLAAAEPLGLFLILRAFSSGCSAMTGIEAIAPSYLWRYRRGGQFAEAPAT